MSPHRRLAVWLFSVAAGTNVPTPLLLLYRDTLDMSESAVTALFGVYAAGLVPALVLAGPAADRFGRRRVAIPATVGAAVASLLFVLAADSVPLLFGARWLQGVVSGTCFSVGSAWLSETSPGRGARTAAVAMTGGFSLGPFVAGVLGEFGPAPAALSYLLHVAVVGVALVVVAPVAETLAERAVGVAAPSGNPLRPGAGWEALTVVAPLAICVYAFPASAINAVPLLVGLPSRPILLTGVLAGLTLGAGTLVAPLQARLGRRTAAWGAGLGAAGFALATVGAAGPRLLLLPAALLMGSGGGLALAAGLTRLPALAREGRLATVSAGFYASAYLGFATPFLLAEVSRPLGIVLPLGVLAGLFALLSVRQAYAAA